MAGHNFYMYSSRDFFEKSAATTRMLYYAKALADEENQVYLLSCCSSTLSQDKFIEVEPNIFVLEKKTLTRNFFSTISFIKALHNFSKQKEGESTFIVYPHPVFLVELISVFYMVFIKKNKVYIELNEVRKHASDFHEPISLKRITYSFKTISYKIIFILMDNLMRFYTGLICISTNIETYGKQYNKNTLRIPILTDPEMIIKTSDKEYSKKDVFNIGFSGSIILNKENLLEFVGVIKKAQQNNFKLAFNLCGTISEKEHQLLRETEYEKNTITYYGNLNEQEMSTFLKQQDVLVIPRGYNLQNKYGFSTKLSDYLNHQKVILITDLSDNGLYIKDGYNGFVVEPNNAKMMYERLIHIIENFDSIAKPIIENAYKTSKEEFDYRLYKEALNTFLIAQ